MIASEAGHDLVVDVLLSANADVGLVDKSGNTAMMLAAANGHAVVVAMLGSVPDQPMRTKNSVRLGCCCFV